MEGVVAEENIDQFQIYVLRLIAYLYKNFPAPVDIDHRTLHPQSGKDTGLEDGTIKWLYEHGLIAGFFQESKPLDGKQTASISDAQLMPQTLRILQAPEPEASGVSLGSVAVHGAFGEREARDAALVFRRLNG
jgi:hypothetical protein